MFRDPTRNSTECPSGGVHMRLPHPAQRFMAPWGAPPNAPVAVSTCVSPPSAARLGPMGSSTEGPRGVVHI
eukprot:810109-Pyramimonas_sp.AAC.1